MVDLSSTIKPKSDQLNADDLIAGPLTIEITDVTSRAGDQPIAISFKNDGGKPYLPCKSMRRVLVQVWGNDGKTYVGKHLTLIRDPKVTWAGAEVGGIRISHMSHIKDKITMSLTANKSTRKPYTVSPMVVKEFDALATGYVMARLGTEELKTWFSKLSTDDKAKIKPSLDNLKIEAAKFDPKQEEKEEVNEENA
jgi:hypothetical protein